MDLTPSDHELAFRDEVRGFIRDNLPPRIKRKVEGGLELVKKDYVA